MVRLTPKNARAANAEMNPTNAFWAVRSPLPPYPVSLVTYSVGELYGNNAVINEQNITATPKHFLRGGRSSG
jgi:hypothetical protein